MDILKRILGEVVATVKLSVELIISFVSRFLEKITLLPKIIYIPFLFLISTGFCLYLSFFSVALVNGQRPWSSLGMPPNAPTEIVTADHTDILVKTNNGEYYRCTFENNDSLYPVFPIEADSSCWRETTKLSIEKNRIYEVNDLSRDKLSWWVNNPGTPVDTLSIVTLAVDAGYSRSYIIDESGEVWVQKADGWSAPDPEFVISLLTGVVGGFILAILLLILGRKYRERTKMKLEKTKRLLKGDT